MDANDEKDGTHRHAPTRAADAGGDGLSNGRRLSARRMIVQAVGFAGGIVLLYLCIHQALKENKFDEILKAGWLELSLLLCCTLISVIANGAIFYVLVRPMKHLGFIHLQFVNAAVNIINYLPVRLGMVTRVAFHHRVDHMPLLQLVGWYAAFAILYLGTLACIALSVLLRPSADVIWILILLGLLAVFVFVVTRAARHKLLRGRWHDADRTLRFPGVVMAVIALRLVDVTAYGTRLILVIRILGEHDVTLKDGVYLTVTSMILNASPVGSLGLREFGLARLGPLLTKPSLNQVMDTAVLLDRASEAIVFIPLGIIACIWMYVKWSKKGGHGRGD